MVDIFDNPVAMLVCNKHSTYLHKCIHRNANAHKYMHLTMHSARSWVFAFLLCHSFPAIFGYSLVPRWNFHIISFSRFVAVFIHIFFLYYYLTFLLNGNWLLKIVWRSVKFMQNWINAKLTSINEIEEEKLNERKNIWKTYEDSCHLSYHYYKRKNERKFNTKYWNRLSIDRYTLLEKIILGLSKVFLILVLNLLTFTFFVIWGDTL